MTKFFLLKLYKIEHWNPKCDTGSFTQLSIKLNMVKVPVSVFSDSSASYIEKDNQ